MAIEVTEEILETSEYFYDFTAGVWGRVWTKAESDAVGDDWEMMYYKTNGGYAFGDWASAQYPIGEAGSRHISRCVPVDRATYENAKANNFNVDVPGVAIVVPAQTGWSSE